MRILTLEDLKDIAHHFVDLNPEKKAILEKVFSLEDELLLKHPSDFVFGIYKLKSTPNGK